MYCLSLVVVQSLGHIRLFVTPWTAVCWTPLSFKIFRSLLKFMSIESVILSSHLILFHLLFLPSIFPSIKVFSNESALRISWPKYWSFGSSISPSSEYSGLIPLRVLCISLTYSICGRLAMNGGEGNGNPLQYSCLENPMGRGAWWAAVHGVTRSQTQLSDFPFTFHFHALEKEMATHSSVLAWRIPGMGEPGGLPSMGLHRVGHDWRDLASAAAGAINGQTNEFVTSIVTVNIMRKMKTRRWGDIDCQGLVERSILYGGQCSFHK